MQYQGFTLNYSYKNGDVFIIILFSAICKILSRTIIETFFLFLFLILIDIFYLLGKPNVAASASLQGTCSEGPQLRTLRLASPAASTRELSR